MILCLTAGMLAALYAHVFAQDWTQVYGGPGHQSPYSFVRTSDEGFVIVGVGYHGEERGTFLTKTDSSGKALWVRSYGDSR